MQFIRRVYIKDFRSIAEVELFDLGDIVPFVGVNGSGKSNLFRAMSLFFNDRVEGDETLDLRRDFREPGRRRRLQVIVEVDLSFGSGIRKEFRDALAQIASGSSDVTIRKTYALDPITDLVTTEIQVAAMGKDLKAASDAERGLVQRLLSAVRFRYVPNHIHPSSVLRSEEQNIRRMLFARLSRGRGLDDGQVDLIREKAEGLMRPVQEAMAAATGEVRRVELGTPGGWKDLVWAFGLRMRASQTNSYEAVLHGSGIQSALAYSVLALVDTSLGGSLGWRRGAVWALEEPESFLHASLQAALASRFSEYAAGQRLQILFTTHCPAFLGTAPEGFAVQMTDAGRSEVTKGNRSDLIRVSQQSGATPFAHPLHLGPPKPMLMVEGKNDRILMTRAYLASREACPFEILALEDLDSNLQGGVDQIRSYLQHNRSALAARPIASPVIVLIDWEESASKENAISAVLRSHATSVCIRMPSTRRNPDLSNDFVGIEGFLSTTFYEAAIERLRLPMTQPVVGTVASHRYAIKREHLKQQKPALHRLLHDRNDASDIRYLVRLVPWINRHVTAGAQLAITL